MPALVVTNLCSIAGIEGELARLELLEQAERRGIPWNGPVGGCAAASLRWLRHTISGSGRKLTCMQCGDMSAQHFLCDCCDLAVCRRCLGVGPDALFAIGFTCIACEVTALPYNDGAADLPYLRELHSARVRTLGARLKPATWLLYQRCIADIQSFILSSGFPVFPILSDYTARLFTYFLQSLKQRGYSWGRIRLYRSAVTAFHRSIPGISAKAADPFRRYPILDLMWQGIHRTVSTVVVPRKPLSGRVLVFMVKSLFQSFQQQRDAHPRTARVALRNALILSFGFFGMRRSAELFASVDRQMGLLVSDVTIVSGERVDLFIRSMKNDTFAQGNRISLAWQTRSGVPLGRMTETYLALLKQDGVQDRSSPFFSPTAASGTFVPVPTGSSSRFNGIVKQLLQHFFPSLSKADLSRFSFHSLRRGGATYARLRGVALGLILRQGLWATLDGARSYIQPSNFEKTLATAEM